jgi:ParB family transcriptional regulator, chromosome partitioning protein
MAEILSANPFRCRVWALHDRLEGYLTEESCRAEIESIAAHGQLVPVLGRRLRNDPDYDIELVYGARRLFIARHLNIKLIVEIRELTDIEAIVAMDIENRHRRDISPYERGLSYARWLRAGHFRSQDDLAKAMQMSKSQVSRLLSLARLPTVLVAAFESPGDICEAWGADLLNALDDPRRRDATIRQARAIASRVPHLPARAVYRTLMAASAATGRRVATHDDVIRDGSGVPLFRVRHQTNSVAFVLPVERLCPQSMLAIKEAIAGILTCQPEASQRVRGTHGGEDAGVRSTEVEYTPV